MNLLLLPLSPISYLVNFIWERYWRRKEPVRVDAWVISVGNITVGGSGKTTVAGFIAERLLGQGKQVALVARGYGRLKASSGVINGAGKIDWERFGDEPAALARAIPGLKLHVGADKTEAARHAAEGGIEYVIVDDGFQHRKLHRDIDIVCIEGERPFGNGLLIPAGRLREPVKSLRRADAVVVFGSDAAEAVATVGITAPLFRARKSVAEICTKDGHKTSSAGGKLLAFCGLGNPTSFKKSLAEAGCDILEFIKYRDHHIYKVRDIEKIVARLKAVSADGAITTLKDLVKVERIWPADIPIYCLRISIELENEIEFLKLLGK